MTIYSSVPSNVDTPNSFHEFRHVKTGGGLVALPTRVLMVGTKSSSGSATEAVPVIVSDETDAITKFGQGTEMHMMCAKAFRQGALNASTGRGGMPELWGCPIADPSGGAARATQTLTVTGPASEAGSVILRIAGRTLTIGVSNGDTANTVAGAIEDAIDAAARELPITAAVSTNVVTCSAGNIGANGNDIVYQVVSAPTGIAIASAQSIAGSGVVDITAAVDAAVDKNYDAVVISNHSSASVTDALAHIATMWGYAQKYWRWVFMGDTATLSTAQGYATSSDSEKIVIVSCEQSPSLPCEIAAAAAVAAFGIERPNANFDGVELAIYPPPTSYAYTATEIESAIDGGVTPLKPTTSGSAVEIVRLVTTRITANSAPFYALADLAFSRTLAYRATQYDVQYRQRFHQEIIDGDLDDENATLLPRVRDMCIEIDREMGRLGYLRNVEDFIAEIRIEEASSPAGRLLVQAPCRVAGPLHQVAFEHINYYL